MTPWLNKRFIFQYFSKTFNENIEKCNFPKEPKLADITPVYEKDNQHNKENHRPITILPVLSKMF